MLRFMAKENNLNHLIDKNYDREKHTELKVIGAGLPRTGTLSLKSALTQLYSAKCYHMAEIAVGDQEDIDVWLRACRGDMKTEDWRQYFSKKNYLTGVDFPFSLFWKDIMEAYPEAKIVLSTRNPTTWYESVYNSIFQFHVVFKTYRTIPWLMSLVDRRKPSMNDMHDEIAARVPDGCKVSFLGAITGGPEVSEQFFLDWEAEVKRLVPRDRLLVHSAKEGWDPLCQFLGVPVPATNYPRVNDTASIKKGIRNILIVNGLIFYVLPLSLVAVASYKYKDELSILLETGLSLLTGWNKIVVEKIYSLSS